MHSFVIRRKFMLPLGILVCLALLLFAVVIAKNESHGKAIILGILILPISGLFLESFFRRAVIDDTSIAVFKPFRQRRLRFDELTDVDTLQVKKRAFLTLSTEEHFIILSNAYDNFPEMVSQLLARIPREVVSEETRQLAEAPPTKSADIVSCWIAVILLGLILIQEFI